MNQNFLSSDPPEIELETNRVHSGINKEAHLTCRVQGNPQPIVSSQNPDKRDLMSSDPGLLVQGQQPPLGVGVGHIQDGGESPHANPEVGGIVLASPELLTMCFSSVHTGFDFGNYSCVAENSIGTFK